MPDKAVPQRGDGFDSGGGQGPADVHIGSGGAGPQISAEAAGMIKRLNVAELANILGTDQKSARILKDIVAGGVGGAGIVAGLELNQALGALIPEEWAGAISGFLSGFAAGSARKKVGGSTVGKNSNKPRRR